MIEYLYMIILVMMIGYTGIYIYMEHRMDKKNKEYQKRINNGK